MRIISFRWFREHCRYLTENLADFEGKHSCGDSCHDHEAYFTTVPEGYPDTGRRVTYHPCAEKHCPALKHLKEIGGT